MAKINADYEMVVIFKPNLTEEETAALVERFKSLIEQHGYVTEVNEWGKRRLAYPIEKLNEGYYVLYTFTADVSLPAELDRVLRINDKVMRSLIVCKDEK